MKLSTNMLALKKRIENQFEQSFAQLIAESPDFNPEICSPELISEGTRCIDQATKEAARHSSRTIQPGREP